MKKKKKIICFRDFSHLFLSLVYTPCLDCYGDEEINILLKENQSNTDIPPASSQVTINVHIQPINDPPVVFLTRNGLFLGNEDITEDTVVCTMNSLLCINWRKTHNEIFLKSNSKTGYGKGIQVTRDVAEIHSICIALLKNCWALAKISILNV